MIKLMNAFKLDAKEMRSYYSDALIEAAENDRRIVANRCRRVPFDWRNGTLLRKFPDRAVNCGIMESHMVGFAAVVGDWLRALCPCLRHVCDCGRAFDQLFLAAGYQQMNIRSSAATPEVDGPLATAAPTCRLKT
jgi:transketolase C-terminal domain/subunit